MSELKYTKNDLQTMQNWDFERKIKVTQTRIIEWYQHYSGQVYISFSGGKDSAVLLDLARRVYPDISAVFVDTGLEYPEIREFVKTIDNVTWLKPSMNFRKVIETYGYPIGSKKTALNIEYGKKAKERGDIEQYDEGKYSTTGCDRTGCVFCGFGCHLEKEPNRFQRLKMTHPKLWKYCMKSWNEGGLEMKKVLECIGVKSE